MQNHPHLVMSLLLLAFAYLPALAQQHHPVTEALVLLEHPQDLESGTLLTHGLPFVNIRYGDIDPATFVARFNDEDVTRAFDPRPDSHEQVPLGFLEGRNELLIEVQAGSSHGLEAFLPGRSQRRLQEIRAVYLHMPASIMTQGTLSSPPPAPPTDAQREQAHP